MFQKIKDFFTGAAGIVIAVLGAAVGILLYFLQLKNKEKNALQARIDLLNTEHESDMLEVEIKQRLENKQLLAKEVQDLNNSLLALQKKREEIKASAANLTPSQIEDYWEKN
jgi:uncharacterized protein HemX